MLTGETYRINIPKYNQKTNRRIYRDTDKTNKPENIPKNIPMEEKNIRDPRPEQEADISSKLNNNKQTDDSLEKESERRPEKESGEKSERGSENRSGAESREDYFDEPGQSADYPEDYEGWKRQYICRSDRSTYTNKRSCNDRSKERIR